MWVSEAILHSGDEFKLPEADVSKVASVRVGRPTFNLRRVVSLNINLRPPVVPEDSSAKIEEMIHTIAVNDRFRGKNGQTHCAL